MPLLTTLGLCFAHSRYSPCVDWSAILPLEMIEQCSGNDREMIEKCSANSVSFEIIQLYLLCDLGKMA